MRRMIGKVSRFMSVTESESRHLVPGCGELRGDGPLEWMRGESISGVGRARSNDHQRRRDLDSEGEDAGLHLDRRGGSRLPAGRRVAWRNRQTKRRNDDRVL
jgi:hypothetical protein